MRSCSRPSSPSRCRTRHGRRCRPDRPTLLADPRPGVPHLASAAVRRVRAPHRRRRDVRPVAAPGSGGPRAWTARTPGRARSPRRGSRRPGSSRPGRARGARDRAASARAGGGPRGRADHRGARGARPQAPRLGGRARGARGHHPAAPGDPVRARRGRRARARRLRLAGRHEADQQADRRRGEQGRRGRTQGRRRGEEDPGGGEACNRHRRAGARDGGPAQGGRAEGGRRREARGRGEPRDSKAEPEAPRATSAAEASGGSPTRARPVQRRRAVTRDSADRRIAAKLKRTEDERDQLMARLGQLEHATTEASATSPTGKSSRRGSRSSRAPVAQTTSSSNKRRSPSRTPG